MKKTFFYTLILCLMVFSANAVQDSEGLWNKISYPDLNEERWDRGYQPNQAEYYSLDIFRAEQLLEATTSRYDTSRKGIVISIPNNEGGFSRFEIYEASVLHKDLQLKYPQIGSYSGFNVDRPYEKIRISRSFKGLNMIVLNGKSGTLFIESVSKTRDQYAVYNSDDLPEEVQDWICKSDVEADDKVSEDATSVALRNADDSQLRIYKIAIACTEEYAGFHVNQAGLNNATDEEKKAAVLAVMSDKMTRVNAVYENSLSIVFEIIPNNEDIIFLSSPFLTNEDYGILLGESQTTIDSYIGSENYDVGHMFAIGNGGVVSGRSCNNATKARGITGTGSPVGNQFEGILMHELGHQFSASHTWNGNTGGCSPGQLSTTSSYEPGSGSTIMGYAGLCGSQNVQTQRDLYFHQRSLEQMWNHVSVGIASSCPQFVSIPNAAPTADAGPNYTIPRRTPYKLVGFADDADGKETLTYCWEQYDLGDPGIPSSSNTTGPLVRSFPPQGSNIRYIPRLEDFKDAFGESTEWEVLSSVDRQMTFKLTVRDNDIDGGQVAVDDMTITVSTEPGQFRVFSQNQLNLTYEGGSTQQVRWFVSGSDEAPINVSQVNILLSTDGGITFDQVLATNLPNNGEAMVTLPDVDAEKCRFMVEAVGNIFFNINFRDFAIEKSLSLEEASINNLAIYPNPNNGLFNIEFDPSSSESIKLQVYDLRGRRVFSQAYESRGRFSETLNLSDADSGVYLLEIKEGQRKATKKIIIN